MAIGKPERVTDEAWIAAMAAVPPTAKVLAYTASGGMIVRRPDGTGAIITGDGEVTEYDAEGRPRDGSP